MLSPRRLLAPLVAGLLLAALPVVPAHADPGTGLTATVDGRDVSSADANSPLVLHPSDATTVQVQVTNNGSTPLEVRSVRLDARVLGLAFFSYTTRVDLTVAPGATGTRTFSLDLSDLDGQADGLLPGSVSVVSPDHTTLATQSTTWDVKGKVLSVYGVFALAVAAITALLLLVLGLRLVRRTLPDNRWSRALLFAVPGVGVGLVAVFTLSLLRVLVPSVPTALGLLAGGLVLGFVLGYLTPAPGDEVDRDELDERDVVDAPPVATRPIWEPGPDLAAAEATPAPVTEAPFTEAPVTESPVTEAPVTAAAPAPATTAFQAPVAPPPDATAPETTAAAADDVPPPPP